MISGWQIVADIFCTGLLLIFSFLLTVVAPIRPFYIDISEWNRHYYNQPIPEEEPLWIMAVFIWIIPIVLISIVTLVFLRSIPKTLLHIANFVYTAALVIFITALFRYFFPSPRPYYYTLCADQSSPHIQGYSNMSKTCVNKVHKRDLQSFPSGHTSAVWAAWIYLLLIFTALSRAFRNRGGFWKLFLFVAPMFIIPIWMSGTRYTTGNHFLYEILIGTLIGIIIPFITFYNVDADLFRRSD